MKLQAIDEPAARIHLDLASSDRTTAIERSTAAGTLPACTDQDVVVMRSPGGWSFCHTLVDRDRAPRLHRGNADVVLDQVCLDIPARWWDVETTFWSAQTDRDPATGSVHASSTRLSEPRWGPSRS